MRTDPYDYDDFVGQCLELENDIPHLFEQFLDNFFYTGALRNPGRFGLLPAET